MYRVAHTLNRQAKFTRYRPFGLLLALLIKNILTITSDFTDLSHSAWRGFCRERLAASLAARIR